MTLIVGEDKGTSFTMLRKEAASISTKISVGRARLKIPYGTHHSKLSIYEANNGRVHIVISTANLLKQDWECKTELFYHCSGVDVSSSSCFSWLICKHQLVAKNRDHGTSSCHKYMAFLPSAAFFLFLGLF